MTEVRRIALERTLRKIAQQRNLEEYQFEIVPTSTDGANYTSCLYRGKIKTPLLADLKFFAKVAAMPVDYREKMPSQIFFIEQYAYKTIADVFSKIQDKYNVETKYRLAMPLVYGYDETAPEEVLVLQDLGAEGYTTHDRLSSIGWPYAAAAVTQLARLHALSIAVNQDFPEEFRDIHSSLKFKQAESLLETVQECMDRSIDLTEECNQERVRSFAQKSLEKALQTYYDIPDRPVMAHGDFKMSNIMHKVNKDGTFEMVIIDYQTIHVSSPMKDLLLFIFTGSDAEFRRKHFHQLLDYYYEQLGLALGRLQLDLNEVYPREEFDFQLKQNMHLGWLFAALYLPALTLKAGRAPAPGDSEENALQIQGGDLCKERLNGIIEDYIRWGEM